MQIDDFYELEPREAFILIEAYHEKLEEHWLHTRELLATLINVNTAKKGKRLKGSDIINLSFDKHKNEVSEDFAKAALAHFKIYHGEAWQP